MLGPSLCSKKIESTPRSLLGTRVEPYFEKTICNKLKCVIFGLAPYNYKLSSLLLNLPCKFLGPLQFQKADINSKHYMHLNWKWAEIIRVGAIGGIFKWVFI